MLKKSKIKENNDVDDEDDAVPLPISTTVTESQSIVTCKTPSNWLATSLASRDHSYRMNEENMSRPSYSDLLDETKALKIKNNILKDKLKASKRRIKVLVQGHEKFTWKKYKTDAKMTFYTGIISLAIFNTIVTLIKQYILHIMYWKEPKHAMRIFKRSGKTEIFVEIPKPLGYQAVTWSDYKHYNTMKLVFNPQVLLHF